MDRSSRENGITAEGEVPIKIALCRPDAVLPSYARPGDAGMDVTAAEDVVILPGETKLVPTGIRVAIPEGYELQVRPRSGISLRTPLRISNSPGTIDPGFRDEVQILMTNTSPALSGGTAGNGGAEAAPGAALLRIRNADGRFGPYAIVKGDRIAQLVLHRVPRIRWEQTGSVDGEGTDRNGGFGSTGV